VLREESPATFSVSIETEATFLLFQCKRDVTAAGHYAAIACEASPLHSMGSSSIFVVG
jgi:hypothetical protein